jgi:putative aminopeptidase FrvX
MPVPAVLKEMLSLPTAPFAENAAAECLRRHLAGLAHVYCRQDKYGNLLARYRFGPTRAVPLAFAAHVDHPGFTAKAMRDEKTLEASFAGFVLSGFFKGAAVKFDASGGPVRGRVLKLLKTVPLAARGAGASRPEQVLLRVEKSVEPASAGVWDLPGPELRDGLLYGAACDDLAGAAALVELLRRLSAGRRNAQVWCLFTRAEEAGFIGAIGAAKAGTLPRRIPVISIEMSREIPPARIGAGPILRVGDRMSTFDPGLTAFCQQVAQNLQKLNPRFRYQRRLMDAGTCESTAYAAYGYITTGLCLALGNYHNMDEHSGRIAPEYISLRDWRMLIDWLEALVLHRPGYRPSALSLRPELERRFSAQRQMLAATRRKPNLP